MPTFAEIAGATCPKDIDGISIAPTLLARGEQARHDYFYWEYHSQGDSQAVRMGDWKAVRTKLRGHPNVPIELYDLAADVGEQHNVAADHPDVVAKMKQIMLAARTESDNPKWNFKVVAAKNGPTE